MTPKISKAYAELFGGGYDEAADSTPTYSVKEAELRTQVMRKALSVLDKYRSTGIVPSPDTPLLTQMKTLEEELSGNLGPVIYYLVRQGYITIDTAQNMQKLPRENQINLIINYLKPDED